MHNYQHCTFCISLYKYQQVINEENNNNELYYNHNLMPPPPPIYPKILKRICDFHENGLWGKGYSYARLLYHISNWCHVDMWGAAGKHRTLRSKRHGFAPTARHKT